MTTTKKWKLPKLTRFFTAWSYSRLEGWRQCAARAAYKHLYKLPEPESAAANRGNIVHKGAEKFLKTPRIKLPPAEFRGPLRKQLIDLRKAGAVAEASWTFTARWLPTKWDDWANAWVRMKIDAHYINQRLNDLNIIDYKTGRIKPVEHGEQGKLYGVGGLIMMSNVKRVRVRFMYADHNTTSPVIEYTRADLPSLQKYWEDEVRPMLADRRFPPKPGQHCDWCPYSRAKGGPCKY